MSTDKQLSSIEPETPDGLTLESLAQDLGENLFYYSGIIPQMAMAQNIYQALAMTVRERLLHRWINTALDYAKQKVKVVCYFSAEYLPGPHLGNNLVNLDVFEMLKKAFEEGGIAWTISWTRKKNPAWETAVWAGWQPATWIPWRLWKYHR
jgi:glucan phosphorylase